MNDTHKDTHGDVFAEYVRKVTQMNAGFFCLREVISKIVPTDFHWYVTYDPHEIVIGWEWRESGYQDEVRVETLGGVLDELSRVSWSHQRMRARHFVLTEGRNAEAL